MKYYELVPVHDARASFYGKALVFDLGNGFKADTKAQIERDYL